jgi:hypothetical protein
MYVYNMGMLGGASGLTLLAWPAHTEMGVVFMLKDAIEAQRAERDQDADCARIDAAIVLSEQDIAALEDRQLDPDEMRKQWSAIRDRTILAIRDLVHHVAKRAAEAKATEVWMIQKLAREETDGMVMGEFSVVLKEVPTRKLVDYLRYLVQIGDRPRIQSVRMVFAARADHQAYDVTFGKMLTQFALAEYGDLGERLARICRLAEKADARIANLFCAYSITNRSHALMPPQLAEVKAPMIDATDIDAHACNATGKANVQTSLA